MKLVSKRIYEDVKNEINLHGINLDFIPKNKSISEYSHREITIMYNGIYTDLMRIITDCDSCIKLDDVGRIDVDVLKENRMSYKIKAYCLYTDYGIFEINKSLKKLGLLTLNTYGYTLKKQVFNEKLDLYYPIKLFLALFYDEKYIFREFNIKFVNC